MMAGPPAPAGSLAVFAYGSLIDDPGGLAPLIAAREPADSPFGVEYARKAISRGGAPSLAPFEGGGTVRGQLLRLDVADDAGGRTLVDDLLRERERAPADVAELLRWTEMRGSRTAYVALPITIPAPEPALLAELALASVSALLVAGEVERNGIRYLRNAIAAGVHTPLTTAYHDAVLRRTGAADLHEAEAATIDAAS